MGGKLYNPKRNLFGFENRIRVPIDLSLAAWNTVATHEVFTVVGAVRTLVLYRVTESLASSGAATVSFGLEGSTAYYAAAQPYTDLTATRWIIPGSSYSTAIINWQAFQYGSGANVPSDTVLDGIDIGYQIATAALTNGTIEAYCYWSPISLDGSVVAGAGGAL